MREGQVNGGEIKSLELRRDQILTQIGLHPGEDKADLTDKLMEIDSRIFFLQQQEAKETAF